MTLNIYTDGGSKGNPGPASIGIVFYLDNKLILKHHQNIGVATNNDAEYLAVICALEKVIDQKITVEKINLYSDSRLLVNQVRGLFKVKNPKIKEYIFKIRTLENQINKPISYFLIPREKNRLADKLVNQKTS